MNSISNRKVLIIDDQPDILEDYRKILAPENPLLDKVQQSEMAIFGSESSTARRSRFDLAFARQGSEGVELAKKALSENRPFALAFVDLRIPPGWDGIETIKRLWDVDPSIQIVICTAFSDQSQEEISAELGQTDRLLILKKPFDAIEVLQLASALTEKWNLSKQLQAQFVELRSTALEKSEEWENQYRVLFENSPLPILIYEQESLRFIGVNEAAVRHYGYSREEFLNLSLIDLAIPDDIPAFREKLARVTSNGGQCGVWKHRKYDRKMCDMEVTSHPLIFSGKKAWFSIALDVTERLSLEAQLRQSQKMDSVGQLAGGIAHDFNNLLTVINGHASLLLAREELTPRTSEGLKEIYNAAKQAASLTRQLLTFSRKQTLQTQVVDLNEVIRNVGKMLRRTLGEDITLEMNFAENLPSIKADLGMIEQVLLNLSVNSRDAMPRGGQLRITTSLEKVDESRAKQNPEMSVGNFICLTFADTGCGIPPENLQRIFEPFFTTKELNRGTGLGLATVYGIIKQHKGWITASSEVGKGATFKIFLPASPEKSGSVAMPSGEQKIIGGTETLLVVEDEAPLLKLIQHILESCGYKVLGCSNANQALELWEQHRDKIELLVTDIVLPEGMAGPQLAEVLQVSRPSLKVIFMSGYDTSKLDHLPHLKEGANFLQKPFHARKLAETVYETITRK